MRQFERFFQMNMECFTPFNESPSYLKGSIKGTDEDKIEIIGNSEFQVIDWYKIGCKTAKLKAHSFAFSVDAVPVLPVGAYSVGIHGNCAINVSHFIKNSVRLMNADIAENAYSGWAYDNSGKRSQQGGAAPWESLGRRHNLMVVYNAENQTLMSLVNGFLIHSIRAELNDFRIVIRFEAVGVSGDFNVRLENICYYSLDSLWSDNISKLKAWDPQYAPVFISYSHADKSKVEPFVADIRREGVRVLGDWDFQTGDSLQKKISQSISRAGYLIVMLSKKSVVSQWVEKELEMGMNRELEDRKVRVLPVLIEDCEIPPFLEGKLYSDIRTEIQEAKDKILDTLRRHGSW